MTYQYEHVYIEEWSTVAGPYEQKGSLKDKFDKHYDDLYCKANTWEQAEVTLQKDSVNILLKKINKLDKDIDVIIGGDLLNQITASSYMSKYFNIPFLGIYSACATSGEGLIIGSSLVDSKKVSNCIITTSSHNMASEKQFRNPTEYGTPKPSTATFTSTGGASIYLTNNITNIKVESSTIGKTKDSYLKDPFNMGGVMAIAAGDTIYEHLKELNRTPNYYDLIITGDLGKYGKDILIEYMQSKYQLDISRNYDDAGTIIYDYNTQKEVLAGGSGPVCSALVLCAKILPSLSNKSLKKVLFVPTGALFSPTFVYQKQTINSIAHAISLEAV